MKRFCVVGLLALAVGGCALGQRPMPQRQTESRYRTLQAKTVLLNIGMGAKEAKDLLGMPDEIRGVMCGEEMGSTADRCMMWTYEVHRTTVLWTLHLVFEQRAGKQMELTFWKSFP